jgi:MTHFR, SAM-binding regulatory domain
MSSDDDVVGWGPKGGYIFQKAFVEFFADQEVVTWLCDRIRSRGNGMISFLAGNLEVSLSVSLKGCPGLTARRVILKAIQMPGIRMR